MAVVIVFAIATWFARRRQLAGHREEARQLHREGRRRSVEAETVRANAEKRAARAERAEAEAQEKEAQARRERISAKAADRDRPWSATEVTVPNR